MAHVIEEWVIKARSDLATARREFAVNEDPNLDAVCFHAQQGIEKLMKALLIQLQLPVPRTHDLVVLARLTNKAPLLESSIEDQLMFLTRAAVEYRYPGESAEPEDAQEALDIATRMATVVETLLIQGAGSMQ
jgi:HEPN domain-containing protein